MISTDMHGEVLRWPTRAAIADRCPQQRQSATLLGHPILLAACCVTFTAQYSSLHLSLRFLDCYVASRSWCIAATTWKKIKIRCASKTAVCMDRGRLQVPKPPDNEASEDYTWTSVVPISSMYQGVSVQNHCITIFLKKLIYFDVPSLTSWQHFVTHYRMLDI